MKDNNKKFMDLFEDLIYLYKDYIKSHYNSRLEVLITKSKIIINLLNEDKTIDKFILTFDDKKEKEFIYISLFLIKILFGNKIIYNKNDIFVNNTKNPSLKIKVDYEKLLDIIINASLDNNDDNYYHKVDIDKKMKRKINRTGTAKFMSDRLEISKLLMSRGNK